MRRHGLLLLVAAAVAAAAAAPATRVAALTDLCSPQEGKGVTGPVIHNLRTVDLCDFATSKRCDLVNDGRAPLNATAAQLEEARTDVRITHPYCAVPKCECRTKSTERPRCLSVQKQVRYCDFGCSRGQCVSAQYCNEENVIQLAKFCEHTPLGKCSERVKRCEPFITYHFDRIAGGQAEKALVDFDDEFAPLLQGVDDQGRCASLLDELACHAAFVDCQDSHHRADCKRACVAATNGCAAFRDSAEVERRWLDLLTDVDGVRSKDPLHRFHACTSICGLPYIDGANDGALALAPSTALVVTAAAAAVALVTAAANVIV